MTPAIYGDPQAVYNKNNGIRYAKAPPVVPTMGGKHMSKVANNISGIPDKEASDKAAKAVTNCSGTQLATPTPPEVAALDTAQKAYDAACADQVLKLQASLAATQVKLQARANLEFAYDKLGGVVQTVTNGVPAAIVATGFDVSASSHTPVAAGPVTGLVVSGGANEGELHWQVKADTGMIILVQTSPDVLPRVWTNQAPVKKHSGTVTGLTSLTHVWVRVAEKGAHDTGPWCDPAMGSVP